MNTTIVILISFPGLAFWLYWPQKRFLYDYARTKDVDKLVPLFIQAMGLNFLSILLGIPFLFCFSVFSIVGGYIGWLLLLKSRLKMAPLRAAFEQEEPLPRLQWNLADLLAALFLWGAGMTVVASSESKQDVIFVAAVYLAAAGAFSLVATLDTLRREPWHQVRFVRIWTLIFMFIYFSMTGIVPALLTYLTWRNALYDVHFDAWREKNSALQKEIRASKRAKEEKPEQGLT